MNRLKPHGQSRKFFERDATFEDSPIATALIDAYEQAADRAAVRARHAITGNKYRPQAVWGEATACALERVLAMLLTEEPSESIKLEWPELLE